MEIVKLHHFAKHIIICIILLILSPRAALSKEGRPLAVYILVQNKGSHK